MPRFFQKIKFISVFWVFFYLFIFSLLLQHSFSYLDPDLGWHLKVGEEIAITQAVPHDNYYNYTFTGKWVDHEWLSNLAIYNIYDSWGYFSLNIIFSGLILVIFILLHIITKQLLPRAPAFLIAFLQLFGLLASLPHFGVRIQEVNLLFLLLLLIIIYLYSQRNRTVWLFLLPPLFYLWVNLHGGFLLGLALLLAFIGIKLFEKVILTRLKLYYIDSPRSISYRNIMIFSGFTFLSVLATFFTPYYLKLYSFLGGYGNTFYLSHIQEWLSQFVFPFNYWQLGYLVLAVVFLGFYIINVFYKRKEKIDLWSLFLVLLFLILSFKSRRHFPLFFVVSFLFLAENIVLFFNLKKKSGPFFNFGHNFFILVCFVTVLLSQAISINGTQEPFSNYCQQYPCEAIEFLKDSPQYDSSNILNDYNWGGFMIWTYPDRKLFIDGRLPQTEFAGHTFLEEYLAFFKKDANFEEKLDEYDIKIVLMKATDDKLEAKQWEKIIFRITEEELTPHNYLRDYLMSANNWTPIYQDSIAVIYLKNN